MARYGAVVQKFIRLSGRGAFLVPELLREVALSRKRIGRIGRLSFAAIFVFGLVAVPMGILQAPLASAATVDVTNCNDSGAGSLRQAVLSANSGDDVEFALSPSCSIITLTSGPIVVGQSITITGPGPSALAVSGGNSSGVFEVDSGVDVSLSELTIEDGNANEGAGLYNDGTLTISDSTLSSNTAASNGGAIFNQSALTIEDSTLSGNSAEDGGGIFNLGTLSASDSTFSGNSAFEGGALNNDGALTLTSSTVSGNSASEDGAGSFNSNSLTMGSTILAGNSGGDCIGTLTDDLGYNLDDDDSCGLSTSDNDIPKTNPLLDTSGLADNGGPTQTIALESGSPAIARVAAADCPATDQRGSTRIDPCDIGAYDTNLVLSQVITITSSAPLDATVGGPTYTVTATGGTSGNPVTFNIDSSATSVCSINGAVVSFVADGTCVIDANQAGNARYTQAAEVQQSFSVLLGQTITFTSTPPTNEIAGGPSYTVTATGGASGNPVVFTVPSSAATVCNVSGSTVNFAANGICIIDANQAGNSTYAAAPQAQQSFSVGQSQTITFISKPPVGATIGSSYALKAVGGGSGNPVEFTTATTTVCKVFGADVRMIAVGSCIIDANQAGNASYAAATQVEQSFSIGPLSQKIRITSTPPVPATVGGEYKMRSTHGPTDKPVVFTSATPIVCKISGSVVDMIAAGKCTIDANQAGNAKYLPAPQVQQTFFVGPSTQTIVFTSTPPSLAKVGGPTYDVTVKGGASGNPVLLTIASGSRSVCSIGGSAVNFIGVGSCTIVANQAGNAGYLTAPEVQQTVSVGQAPAMVSSCPQSAGVGQSYECNVVATGSPSPTFKTIKLPSWLRFSQGIAGSGTGTISGSPRKPGTYAFTLNATNVLGTATQSVTITVT